MKTEVKNDHEIIRQSLYSRLDELFAELDLLNNGNTLSELNRSGVVKRLNEKKEKKERE